MSHDPWTAAMLRGDFAAAWAVCDRVLRERIRRNETCFDWPRHLQFVWRGQSIENRRVLVRCYHGLGDTIQFVRLLSPLRARAREVILWAQPSLLELLRHVDGIDRLLPLQDREPDVEYDVDVELMELGHVMRVTPATLPAEVPYIYVSPSRPAPRRYGMLRVGIAWRSGDWNPDRSIPDAALASLGEIESVRWYSLQYPLGPVPLDAEVMACQEIHTMAERMHSLDLVISVDSMPAHLAGALGLPVWTLLPEPCDWRWLSGGERSPWYPTMRLFRQPRAGDWRSVLKEVRSSLAAVVGQKKKLSRRSRRSQRKIRRLDPGARNRVRSLPPFTGEG